MVVFQRVCARAHLYYGRFLAMVVYLWLFQRVCTCSGSFLTKVVFTMVIFKLWSFLYGSFFQNAHSNKFFVHTFKIFLLKKKSFFCLVPGTGHPQLVFAYGLVCICGSVFRDRVCACVATLFVGARAHLMWDADRLSRAITDYFTVFGFQPPPRSEAERRWLLGREAKRMGVVPNKTFVSVCTFPYQKGRRGLVHLGESKILKG
jgi:hypothetical protein